MSITRSICKEVGIRIFEFVAKTLFLFNNTVIVSCQPYKTNYTLDLFK